MVKRKTTGHPILPIKDFDWLLTHWGEESAVEILDKVQSGEMTVEQVERGINGPIISFDCINCQQSLSGGDLTHPWEDGNNSNAYVICPHCRTKNILYGFGGDDD
jgi:hypothetical protein